MPVQLPEPITAYVAAENAADPAALARCFTEDAVVRDEGGAYAGPAAIREWAAETHRKYGHSIEALASEQKDGQTIVTNRLTGTFPGSPIELAFVFRLARDKIASLEIRS
jgi:ketosteroid isomerase-like protein